MANFFDYLPDIYYGVEVSKNYLEENSIEYVLGKNFFRSARIRDDFEEYATLFKPHYIGDGERPDNVAVDLYGDPELDWLILLTNDIFDMYIQWPKSEQELKRYCDEIYGEGNDVKVHHWETKEVKSGDTVILQGGMHVMPNFTFKDPFTGLAVINPAYSVSNYEYEQNLNEKKRFIYVMDPNIIDQFIDEFENLCAYEEHEELEEDGAPLTELLEVGRYLGSQSGVAIYPTFGKYKNFLAAAQSTRAVLQEEEVVQINRGVTIQSSLTGNAAFYNPDSVTSGSSSSDSSSSSSSSGSSSSSSGSSGSSGSSSSSGSSGSSGSGYGY